MKKHPESTSSDDQLSSMAEKLLDNKVFGDMMQNLKWEYFVIWTLTTDVKTREEIHAKLLGTLKVQTELERIYKRAKLDQETDQESEKDE